jgi:hypothetical protein
MQNIWRSCSITVVVFVLIATLCSGCTSGAAEQQTGSSPSRIVLAIDTSGSAEKKRNELYKRASEDFFMTKDSDKIVVFRFDTDPAEIYSGETPASEEDAAKILKKVLPVSQSKPGTNLLKLVRQLDELGKVDALPLIAFVYTDCGFEEMTNQELDECKELTANWAKASKQVEFRFIGVEDGYREKLRKLIAIPREQVKFLD